MQQLLQQGLQVCRQLDAQLKQQPHSQAALLQAENDLASVAALCSCAVAQLNMQQLAAAARDVVVASRVGQQRRVAVPELQRLWVLRLVQQAWVCDVAQALLVHTGTGGDVVECC
jgi:hypothetical protein